MKLLMSGLLFISLAGFTSCSHMHKHDCCHKGKAHHEQCKDGCKPDKSCCKDKCEKCDGKSGCKDGSCDLKKKK